MQLSAPVRVVNGSAFVELLYVLTLTGITGTYAAGDGLTFTGGATAVCVATDTGEVTCAVTSVQQPIVGDTVTSDGGGAGSGTLATFATAPDLSGAGIDGEEWFIREGDGVAYRVSAVPSNSRAQLTAPYGGASSIGDTAVGVFHSTRTPEFGLPSFDRRDRQVQVLLSEMAGLLDAVLADHEARLVALEP